MASETATAATSAAEKATPPASTTTTDAANASSRDTEALIQAAVAKARQEWEKEQEAKEAEKAKDAPQPSQDERQFLQGDALLAYEREQLPAAARGEVPGGRYIVNNMPMDANGNRIKTKNDD